MLHDERGRAGLREARARQLQVKHCHVLCENITSGVTAQRQPSRKLRAATPHLTVASHVSLTISLTAGLSAVQTRSCSAYAAWRERRYCMRPYSARGLPHLLLCHGGRLHGKQHSLSPLQGLHKPYLIGS